MCAPINVPSRITSRHHWIIDRIITEKDISKHKVPWPWNHLTRPTARRKAPRADVKGHGLNSTRWKGCRGITFFKFKLSTWKVAVLFILKTYKRGILVYKFTVYCLFSAILQDSVSVWKINRIVFNYRFIYLYWVLRNS